MENFKKETFKVGSAKKEYYIYHKIESMKQLMAFIKNNPEEPVGFKTKKGEFAMTSKKTAVKWVSESFLERGVYIIKSEDEIKSIVAIADKAQAQKEELLLNQLEEHGKVVEEVKIELADENAKFYEGKVKDVEYFDKKLSESEMKELHDSKENLYYENGVPEVEEEDIEFSMPNLKDESFEDKKKTFAEFFWTWQRAGLLMLVLAFGTFMIFHNETRVNNFAFYIGWIVFFYGIAILYAAVINRDWNRIND